MLGISPFCQQIFEKIYDLALYTRAPDQSNFDKPEGSCLFLYQRLALEQELLCHLAMELPEKNPSEACVYIGLLIFINTAFWINFDSSCAILTNLSYHLRQRWSQTEELLHGHNLGHRRLLLWLLFLGAHASRNTGTFTWFLQQLQVIAQVLSIGSKAELEEALADFIYIQGPYRKTLHELSTEIFIHQEPLKVSSC